HAESFFMFLYPKILDALQTELGRDCLAFLPELILCGSIVLLLLFRLFKVFDAVHLGWFALLLTLAALYAAWQQWWDPTFGGDRPRDLFTGLLAFDNLTVFLRLFLLGFAALLIWLSLLTGIPDREDSADFHCLLLGATLGMCIMASANHL